MEFKASPAASMGIEIEWHLLDAQTLDLVDAAPVLLAIAPQHPCIKPEFHKAMVEVNSHPCATIDALQTDILTIVKALQARCEQLGLAICGAGTHPFCLQDATVSPLPRYLTQYEQGGYLARRFMTCALHVHIGMPSGDDAIATMNALRPYVPILLALSASSPFWRGYDTGYASFRQRILASTRSYGLPPYFHNWRDFADLFHRAQQAGVITLIRDIHWDLRPHADLGTLELRIMDSQPTLREAIALTALVHSLVTYIQHCRQTNQPARLLGPVHPWFERENYFRASHHGLAARYIADNQGHSQPMASLVRDLLATLRPIADQWGETEQLSFLEHRLDSGSSAMRQRQVFHQTGSVQAVTAHLVHELAAELANSTTMETAIAP